MLSLAGSMGKGGSVTDSDQDQGEVRHSTWAQNFFDQNLSNEKLFQCNIFKSEFFKDNEKG